MLSLQHRCVAIATWLAGPGSQPNVTNCGADPPVRGRPPGRPLRDPQASDETEEAGRGRPSRTRASAPGRNDCALFKTNRSINECRIFAQVSTATRAGEPTNATGSRTAKAPPHRFALR